MSRLLTIHGIGAVTPLGRDWPTTWAALLAKTTGLASTEKFGFPIDPPITVGAIADLPRQIEPDGRGPAARLIRSAIDQVSLPSVLGPPTIWGGSNHGETGLLDRTRSGVGRDPLPGLAVRGPTAWVASACTTGLHALFFCLLEARRSGAWLAVAGDALSDIGIAGFARSGATGRGLPEPLREGSPGMLVSEGAVALGLATMPREDMPSILGMGISSDAGHPTHPDPTGQYVETALRQALSRAGLASGAVAAVVAHGTGTTANDQSETEVIARVFGRCAATSAKGATGHIMGAAGLLNVAIATEIWRTGLVPPTLGRGEARAGLRVSSEIQTVEKRRPVVVLASGFGGNNVAAVIG